MTTPTSNQPITKRDPEPCYCTGFYHGELYLENTTIRYPKNLVDSEDRLVFDLDTECGPNFSIYTEDAEGDPVQDILRFTLSEADKKRFAMYFRQVADALDKEWGIPSLISVQRDRYYLPNPEVFV